MRAATATTKFVEKVTNQVRETRFNTIEYLNIDDDYRGKNKSKTKVRECCQIVKMTNFWQRSRSAANLFNHLAGVNAILKRLHALPRYSLSYTANSKSAVNSTGIFFILFSFCCYF